MGTGVWVLVGRGKVGICIPTGYPCQSLIVSVVASAGLSSILSRRDTSPSGCNCVSPKTIVLEKVLTQTIFPNTCLAVGWYVALGGIAQQRNGKNDTWEKNLIMC